MAENVWLKKREHHFDWMQKSLSCWRMCEELIAWAIQNQENLDLINVCRDVSEMCGQCIKFEAQRSPFFNQLCEVCADICDKCIIEIQNTKSDEPILLETSNICKILSEASREIAGGKTQTASI